MKETLNRRIKHREIFRPFAPSILAESTAEYFEKSHPSPFMTLAYSVRPENETKLPRRRTWMVRAGCRLSPARPIPAITRAFPFSATSAACSSCSTRPSTTTSPSSAAPKKPSIVCPHADGCASPRGFSHFACLSSSTCRFAFAALAKGGEVWQPIGHGKQGQRQTRSQETAEKEADRS
jgi:Carbamoyltransferase C-terminus